MFRRIRLIDRNGSGTNYIVDTKQHDTKLNYTKPSQNGMSRNETKVKERNENEKKNKAGWDNILRKKSSVMAQKIRKRSIMM